MESSIKKEVNILQSSTLSGIVAGINKINAEEGGTFILKDDILSLQQVEGTWILLYYK